MTLAWKQVMVAFLLGACVGAAALGGKLWSARKSRWDSGHSQQQLLKRFNDALQLTPAQQPQVAAILEAKRQKIDALRAEMRPRFEEVRAAARAELRPLLTPAQQDKLEAMETKWEQRKQRWGWGRKRHHE
jgi:Spy/CpxP family protein refolding chaperone